MSGDKTTLRKGRMPQLDFLRGIAILLVLLHHFPLLPFVSSTGWSGVDLFFVLSGFLVSGLIFREMAANGSFSMKTFLIRRGLKIYPMFYLFTAFSVALVGASQYLTGSGKTDLVPKLLAEIAFVQNYFDGMWGHTWSLAIEEHFYILLAVSLWVIFRFDTRHHRWMIPGYLMLMIVVVTAIRVLTFSGDYSMKLHHMPTHLRIDSLLIGVVLAYGYHVKHMRLGTKTAMLVAGAGALFAIYVLTFPAGSDFMSTWGYVLLAVGFGAVLIGLMNLDSEKVRIALGGPVFDAMCSLGFYSYGVYLYHMVPKVILERTGLYAMGSIRIPLFFAYLVVAIGLGVATSKFVEMKVLDFRDRVFPRRTPPGFSQSSQSG